MNSLFSKAIFAFVLMTNMSANAQTVNKSAADKLSKARATQSAKGGVATGGGDLCEDRIKSIRDDLKSWLLKGGAKTLQLPAGFSAGQYTDDMLEQIYAAKIRCVMNGDAGYPVTVDGIAKVCRFDRSSSSSLITCDLKKFQAMSEESQYGLVHHEFAGLADIERPNGSDSNYSVSNQISQSLESIVVKRLAIVETIGFQEIPAHQIEGYLAAIGKSFKDLHISRVKFCKKSTTKGLFPNCEFIISDEFESGIQQYKNVRIKKAGKATEIIITGTAAEREMRTVRVTYHDQEVRSIDLSLYNWEFAPVKDIANPPIQKSWVHEITTTWFRK